MRWIIAGEERARLLAKTELALAARNAFDLNGEPKFRQWEPAGRLAAAGGRSAGSGLSRRDGRGRLSYQGQDAGSWRRLIDASARPSRASLVEMRGAWVFKGTRLHVVTVIENSRTVKRNRSQHDRGGCEIITVRFRGKTADAPREEAVVPGDMPTVRTVTPQPGPDERSLQWLRQSTPSHRRPTWIRKQQRRGRPSLAHPLCRRLQPFGLPRPLPARSPAEGASSRHTNRPRGSTVIAVTRSTSRPGGRRGPLFIAGCTTVYLPTRVALCAHCAVLVRLRGN